MTYNVYWGFSHSLNTFLVCFGLSSGMPFLNLICAISLIFTYVAEKYKLIEHSKIPEKLSNLLLKMIYIILYLGLILHIVISISMLGNTELFLHDLKDVEDIDSSKITQLNVSYLIKA